MTPPLSSHPNKAYTYRPERDTYFTPYAPTFNLPFAYHDTNISMCGTHGLTQSYQITPSPLTTYTFTDNLVLICLLRDYKHSPIAHRHHPNKFLIHDILIQIQFHPTRYTSSLPPSSMNANLKPSPPTLPSGVPPTICPLPLPSLVGEVIGDV